MLLHVAWRRLWRQISTSSLRSHYELNEKIRKSSASPVLASDLVLNTPASEFNSINCATALHVLVKTGSKNAEAIQKIISISDALVLEPSVLSSICYSLAAGRLVSSLPAPLVQRTLHRIGEFNEPRDIANLAWSFARFNHRDGLLFSEISKLARARLEDFKPQELSNLIWSFAKLGENSEELCRAISISLCNRNLDDFSSQALANIIWALATLGMRGEKGEARVCHRIATMLASRLDLTPQDYANVVWALATLECDSAEFLQSLEQRIAGSDLHRFSIQALANITWALAKFGRFHSFTALARELNGRREVFPVRALTSILWAYSKHKSRLHVAFCQSLHRKLAKRCSHFTPLDYAMTFQSLGSWGDEVKFPCAPFCDALLRRAPPLTGFSPTQLSMIVTALANCRHRGAEVLAVISNKLITTLENNSAALTPQEMSMIMHALALLDYRDNSGLLGETIADEAVRRGLKGFSSQDIIQLLWAYACLDMLASPHVQQLFDLHCQPPAMEKTVSAAQQLFQVRLAWQQQQQLTLSANKSCALLDSLLGDDGWVDRLVEQDLRALRFAARQHQNNASWAQGQVYRALKPSIPDLQWEAEVRGISVDMYSPSLNTAIEVDGPYHFFVQDDKAATADAALRPTGTTLFKRRLLEHAGCQFHSLPVYSFQRHKMGSAEQAKVFDEFAQAIITRAKQTK